MDGHVANIPGRVDKKSMHKFSWKTSREETIWKIKTWMRGILEKYEDKDTVDSTGSG